MNTPKRITDKAKPWIVKAIKEHGNGEAILWELAVMAYPDPSVTDEESSGAIPVLVLYLEIPGRVVDTSIYGSAILAPFQLKEGRVNESIKVTLESLLRARDGAGYVERDAA